MPLYLNLNSPYWISLIWPILAAPALFAIIAAFWAIYLSKSKHWAQIAGSVFGFALMGMVTGFLTGLSGESTVLQAVLPAVLSLVAGLAAFLVSRNPNVADLVAPTIGGLALAILLGSLWGSNERRASEMAAHALDTLETQAGYEAKLRLFRGNLSIPQEPPVMPIIPSCHDANAC